MLRNLVYCPVLGLWYGIPNLNLIASLKKVEAKWLLSETFWNNKVLRIGPSCVHENGYRCKGRSGGELGGHGGPGIKK